MRIVPDKEDEIEEDESRVIKYIDDRMIQTPPIALASTIKEVARMGEKARDSVDYAMEGILEASSEGIEGCFKQEKSINQLQKTILNYLLKLSKAPLSEEDRETVDTLFNTVNDIERIGDHAENLAEIAQSAIDGQVYFSEQGQNEISDMYNKVIASYSYALEAMVTSDVNLACKVIKMEEQVDIMEESCRVNHMRRLNNNLCSIDNGIIYFEILANLERISDHACNLCDAAKEMAEKNMAFSEKATQELHIFTEAVKEIVNTSFSAFKKEDVELAGTVEPLEEVIDDLNMELKTRHIRRLREGKCTIDLGFVHSDITTNYERIADHCSNIAVCLIQVKQEGFDTHEYLGTIKREDNEQFKKQYAVFEEKYRLP